MKGADHHWGEVLEFTEWAAVIKIAADAKWQLTVIETRHDPGEARAHVREAALLLRAIRATWAAGLALRD